MSVSTKKLESRKPSNKSLTEQDILTLAGEIVAVLKKRTNSYEGCVNALAAARSAIAGSALIPTEDFGFRLRAS